MVAGTQYTSRLAGWQVGRAGHGQGRVPYCTVPRFRSYVGFGVHQIEFATTHSRTRPHAHFWPFYLPSHTTTVSWNNLPGLPCFTQPVLCLQHPSCSLNLYLLLFLSLACPSSAYLTEYTTKGSPQSIATPAWCAWEVARDPVTTRACKLCDPWLPYYLLPPAC